VKGPIIRDSEEKDVSEGLRSQSPLHYGWPNLARGQASPADRNQSDEARQVDTQQSH
jgi:hypothetical protein